MRDAEGSKGGLLGQIDEAVDDSPQSRSAGGNVVEAGVNVGTDDEVDIEAGEEALDAAAGVNPDVVAETIADEIGQVVDQRQEAEYKTVAEKKAVGLERVKTVRRIDDDASTGAGAAIGFQDGLAIVGDVLDDLVQEDDVEGVLNEGKVLGLGE
jgi:hypothetical protein